MTLSIEWAVHIGDVATATDFSDRATGISIRQPLGFMQPASHQCVLTLNNFDGALTPGAGGTYSSINWFEQAIFVTCTVNGTDTAEVFHGIIDDFDLADDESVRTTGQQRQHPYPVDGTSTSHHQRRHRQLRLPVTTGTQSNARRVHVLLCAAP
jgi:hypothetical protein